MFNIWEPPTISKMSYIDMYNRIPSIPKIDGCQGIWARLLNNSCNTQVNSWSGFTSDSTSVDLGLKSWAGDFPLLLWSYNT